MSLRSFTSASPRVTAYGCGAALAFAAGLAGTPGAAAQTLQARIIVQSSPLAGFRHYEAPNLWGEIAPGDPLTLVREPDNPHDPNAVRVEWRTFKLGYVPRVENEALARMQSERPTSAGTTNLGALLKAKLDTANSSSEQ